MLARSLAVPDEQTMSQNRMSQNRMSQNRMAQARGPKRAHRRKDREEELLLKEADEELAGNQRFWTRLSEQPKSISGGVMKPYQLEVGRELHIEKKLGGIDFNYLINLFISGSELVDPFVRKWLEWNFSRRNGIRKNVADNLIARLFKRVEEYSRPSSCPSAKVNSRLVLNSSNRRF